MYEVDIAAPLLVITNVAVPALDVHMPVAVSAGGGGGGTQSDISAVVVKPASLGLDSV